MNLNRRRSASTLWLLLAAVVYRALLPAGWMPGDAAQLQAGHWLVWCSGDGIPALFAAHGQRHGAAPNDGTPPAHADGSTLCVFALAAGATLPSAALALTAIWRAPLFAPRSAPRAPLGTQALLRPPARAPPIP